MAEPYYTDKDALNAELGLALSASQALPYIQDAEDAVDRMLGGWLPDQTTGRKIIQGDVDAYQWDKLKRATTKMAAAIYRDPDLLTRRAWSSVSGPDFSFSGPAGAGTGTLIVSLLDDSGLRRLAGRAMSGVGSRRRPDYDRFLKATRHDGT